MRSFLRKLEIALRRLMEGRNGSDQMGMTALIISLILSFVPYMRLLSLGAWATAFSG